MAETDVAAALREAMTVALHLGGPPLAAALVVGLVMSLLQAMTQVTEATVAFVPKVAAVGAALIFSGPAMLQALSDFMHTLAERVAAAGAP